MKRGQTRMEKVLFIIAASGLCAVSSNPERYYQFVYDQKTWTEALSYCREKYTDLATIEDMEDMKTLNDMADLSKMVYSENSYGAWIGLHTDLNRWRWSLSDRGFYNNGEAEFRNWSPGEPNNKGNREHCTQMYDDGFWNDRDCDTKCKTVCSDVRVSDETFVFIKTFMTWTEAQSYCRAHYTDLASVRNMSENQKLKEVIPAGEKPWIGLFRDYWKWSDGSNSSFRYWETNETKTFEKETCVAAYFKNDGKWKVWDCDRKTASVCYSDTSSRKKVLRLRLLKDPSMYLNDSAVMEHMLKQLEQKLKDQGVNGDINLSWRRQSDGTVFHKDEKETKKKTFKKKDEF